MDYKPPEIKETHIFEQTKSSEYKPNLQSPINLYFYPNEN